MSEKHSLQDALDQGFVAVKKYIDAALDEVVKAHVALKRRVEALEDRGTLEYRGVWERGLEYHKGDLVSKSGSLWIALTNCSGWEPDTPNTGTYWKLCVKRGRDGKDAR